MSPRIHHIHPLAGVEGGRVTIWGEDLLSQEGGSPTPQFEKALSRPLIAAPDRIICPIPEGAESGFLRVMWPEAVADGPYFEVAVKLADELHPVANPVVDREGFIVTTFSGSRGQAAPNGVSVFRIPSEGGAEAYISGVMNPTGLALGPDGTLFMSCRGPYTFMYRSPT